MADSAPEAPPPPKKREKLERVEEVRRALARTMRKLEHAAMDPDAKGAMPVEHARTLIYGYSKLAEMIRAGSVDEVLLRLQQLEARQMAIDSEQREREAEVKLQ